MSYISDILLLNVIEISKIGAPLVAVRKSQLVAAGIVTFIVDVRPDRRAIVRTAMKVEYLVQ